MHLSLCEWYKLCEWSSSEARLNLSENRWTKTGAAGRVDFFNIVLDFDDFVKEEFTEPSHSSLCRLVEFVLIFDQEVT